MILLVVGLVAVIVVVLIAVFLSIRLGRGEEHDESGMGPSSRDRRRDQDERWRERDGRRAPSSASRTAGRGGRDSGYGSRGPARERDSRSRDYDGPRRPSRPQASGSRRPAAARPAVGASASARGRHDAGPSRHPAAEDYPSSDYPSSDYPSMDFAPGGRYPSGDHPSGQFPAAGDDAMDAPRGGPGSRRKPAPGPAGGKSRSRQRGKRDDDNDWPSTEWDKLSDEQYWAELSADKPLSSMARPAKAAVTPASRAPVNGVTATASPAKPAPRETRAARTSAPERDLPGRTERGGQREPATGRLPVRGARQAAPAPAAGRSYPDPVLDTGPRSARDSSYREPRSVLDTGPQAARESVPQPRAGHRRRDTTGPQPTRDRDQDLAMLTGMASAPPPIPGALQDDPLTSPSFSLKAAPTSDSRSYSNARKHAKTSGQPAANGAAPASGNSGSYPAGDYADPGYAYHAAPPAAVPPQAPAADWHSTPSAPPPAEAQAPLYPNPYQEAGSAARFTDGQPAAGYASYHTDPLRVYSPDGGQAPAPYDGPASTAGYQQPPAGTAPYTDSYRQNPYPDQAGYQDGYSTGGYTHGYEGGYTGDPYAAGGYGPYPPQG